MKTIVTFKALADTKARDESGIKISVKKGKEFTTSESNAKIYRGYKRLFEEVKVELMGAKKDKNTPKNSDAFPVSISDEMTNWQIEALLESIGAKYKKKDSRANLILAFNARTGELEEEKAKENEQVATDKFKAMIDNRTLEQLEELVNDLDEAVNVDWINKEVCREYILEMYDEKLNENLTSKDGDEEGNSEGTLTTGELEEGSLDDIK